MTWYIKTFQELTAAELYAILRVRAEVFVVEQTCVYQDVDNKDQKAYHLWTEENGEVTAYLRILQKGVSYPETAIGRVLVKESHRRHGLAEEMMQKAITFVKDELGEAVIRISAQHYLQKFYEKLGFVQTSEVYLEDGIEHIEMLRRDKKGIQKSGKC